MSKTLIEAPITTRRARSGLAIGVHWRGLDPDIHLGYRKGKRGGRWLVRWYTGDQQYRQEKVGTADDLLGEGNLSFEEASRLARQRVAEARREAEKALLGPAITVRSAVDNYVAMRDARETARVGRPIKSDAHRLKRYVTGDPKLADRELRSLTELDLKAWQERLTGLTRSSRRRLASDFKAALNACFLDHRRTLPADMPVTVKYGLNVEAPEWDEGEGVAAMPRTLFKVAHLTLPSRAVGPALTLAMPPKRQLSSKARAQLMPGSLPFPIHRTWPSAASARNI